VAVVAVVLGLDEMLFALAPQGGRPTEATCAFAGALVNVLGVNVLGFGVWTLIYTAPRWDALVLDMVRPVWRSFSDRARPRRAALYASYGLLVGFHTARRERTRHTLLQPTTENGLPWFVQQCAACRQSCCLT
jgi:hypothetical protein